MAYRGKTLIIVQNLPVPFDRRVWLEAMTLRDAGYKVSVICPKDRQGKYARSHEVIDGIHIYRYAAPPDAESVLGYVFEFAYCWLRTALLSLRVWYVHGFDVLHACNPPDTYWVLGRIYGLLGKRFLFDHHDLSPEMYCAKGGKPGGFLYRALLWLEKQTFKTADVLITTNQSHREIAMERGGVAPSRAWIVRSGPDPERLRWVDPEPGLKRGRPFLVCYLGEMCSQDGVDQLLDIAAITRRDLGRRDITFVLMGGGPELEKLRARKSQMGLGDFVVLTGRVSDADLCRYLSTADVCVDPTPWSEWSDRSTMNKIVEYMAFGKPVVAFDLKEHRFSAERAALYVRPDDVEGFAKQIVKLLNDPAKRENMGGIGEVRIREELSWDHSKAPLLAAYNKAMARR